MLHRVRLMFLTAVLVLFASFPSIAAPVNDGAHDTVDISLSVNVVGIVPATVNHNIALMPDDGQWCFHCPNFICSHGGGCDYHPPAVASVSLIGAYVDPGPASKSDTERERQRA